MAKVRRKKKRQQPDELAQKNPPPKSFVFAFGKQRNFLRNLQNDLRSVMSPYTATDLRVSKNNVLKDFLHVAGPLGVTHMIMLTGTEKASYLKLCKSPRGPTATLKIKSYSLMRDVQSALARPRCPESALQCPPLVVLNGFGGDQQVKLTGVLFQNMFPSINVNTAKASDCQRVVLLSHNKETDSISLRQYSISLTPTGLTKGIKALVNSKVAPDLSRFSSIAEFVEKAGYASDSDAEDAAKVPFRRVGGTQGSSRVKLHEIGPRVEMELLKIQEGLSSGRVLYHRYESRTEEEVAAQQVAIDDRERLRAERRRQQEENVQRKAVEKKREELARQEKSASKKAVTGSRHNHGVGGNHSDDDDEAYYEREVGVKPDSSFGQVRRYSKGQGAKSNCVEQAGGKKKKRKTAK